MVTLVFTVADLLLLKFMLFNYLDRQMCISVDDYSICITFVVNGRFCYIKFCAKMKQMYSSFVNGLEILKTNGNLDNLGTSAWKKYESFNQNNQKYHTYHFTFKFLRFFISNLIAYFQKYRCSIHC